MFYTYILCLRQGGKSEIVSYINNLDRARYPQLYELFARGFDCVLPLLMRVTKKELLGRKLQVITKACTYVLQPGEQHQGEICENEGFLAV